MTSLVCSPKLYANSDLDERIKQDFMLPRTFQIVDIQWEIGSGDVYTWELQALDGKPFCFAPGQFNMLYMQGKGEVPISISSDSESDRLIHTTRAVGAVTQGMATLKVGDTIGVRGPFGTAWPLESAKGKDVVILCGGLGLPPLRPFIYYLLNHRSEFNKIYLLYGARSPLEIVYKAELESLHYKSNIEVLLTVDRQAGQWDGNIGVVPQLLSQVDVDTQNTLVSMCGPEIMMHFAQIALHKMGIFDEQIYVSMERNMKCAIGHCGHCQWGPHFICKDGPVFRYDAIRDLFKVHEL